MTTKTKAKAPAAKGKAKAAPKKQQAVKRGLTAGTNPIPTTAKEARTVGQLTRKLLVDGADTATILAEIAKRFPESAYNRKSVSWQRWELKTRHGVVL